MDVSLVLALIYASNSATIVQPFSSDLPTRLTAYMTASVSVRNAAVFP